MRSISSTANEAMNEVKDTAGQAKGSFLEFGAQALKLLSTLRDVEIRSADSLLGRVGLQRRESALRPMMWFAAGGVAAGAVALVMAPVAGKELRARLADMLSTGLEKAKGGLDKAKDTAKQVGKGAESKAEDAINGAKKTVAHVASTAVGAASNVESRVQHGVDEIRRNTHAR